MTHEKYAQLVQALRELADQIDQGHWRYDSGSFVITRSGFMTEPDRVKIRSDLVLAPSTPSTPKRMPQPTDWFPPEVKPVREGVYQRCSVKRLTNIEPVWSRWDGSKWCAGWWNFDRASKETVASGLQGSFWRGLDAPSE